MWAKRMCEEMFNNERNSQDRPQPIREKLDGSEEQGQERLLELQARHKRWTPRFLLF